jgi:hypothetical protein
MTHSRTTILTCCRTPGAGWPATLQAAHATAAGPPGAPGALAGSACPAAPAQSPSDARASHALDASARPAGVESLAS